MGAFDVELAFAATHFSAPSASPQDSMSLERPLLHAPNTFLRTM
jgi:hypothetical protein